MPTVPSGTVRLSRRAERPAVVADLEQQRYGVVAVPARRPAQVLEHGVELRGRDGDDHALSSVHVRQRLELRDHVGAGVQRGRHHGPRPCRAIGCRADRHEDQGRSAVQGHVRHATRTLA